MTARRIAAAVAKSTASGVLGWIVIMGGFEAAYWGQAYATHLRRKWKRNREGSC